MHGNCMLEWLPNTNSLHVHATEVLKLITFS